MSDAYPLTNSQKRIWYLEKIYPGMPINTIGGYVKVDGFISFPQLRQAILDCIDAHESLQLHIMEREGEPLQYRAPKLFIEIPFIDFSQNLNPENAFEVWIQKVSTDPLALYHSPLFSFALFKLSERVSGYLVKLHHIIADVWSVTLMIHQIHALYERRSTPSPSNFLEQITAERAYLLSKRCFKDRTFWLNRCAHLPPASSSPKIPFLESCRHALLIDPSLTKAIRSFCTENSFSLTTLVCVAMALYNYSKIGQKEQLFILPIYSRSGPVEKATFGMFVNSLCLFISLTPTSTIMETCCQIKKTLKQLYVHHKYPFDLLARDLKKRGIDLNAHIHTSINVYQDHPPSSFDSFSASREEFFTGHQLYPLHILLNEWPHNQLELRIHYQTDKYTQKDIEQMGMEIKHFFMSIISRPTQYLDELTPYPTQLDSEDLSSLSKAPYKNLVAVLPPLYTLIDVIEEQALSHPAATALEAGHFRLSYGDLICHVNHLALHLASYQGPIAIIGKPSIESVIAMLAILKIGSCYIPIDDCTPIDQMKQILSDSQVTLMLIWEDIPSLPIKTLDVRSFMRSSPPNISFLSRATLDHLAYIIYTSGTTGTPKGVQITHRNLMSYLNWAKTSYCTHPHPVFAIYTSIAFDLTITSLFLPLITGGKGKIFQSDEQHPIFSIIKDHEVTLFKATPSLLNLIATCRPTSFSMKVLIVGGEAFPTALARKLQQNFGSTLQIYNEYGPTEATVGCMLHRFNPDIDCEYTVPIGTAAGSTQLIVLNEALKIVTREEMGELYIGGDQVTKGYLNTSSDPSFILLPNFHYLFYRTGDCVYQNARNEFVFHGRLSKENKLHGYRIDLSEIESLSSHLQQIKQAVAIIIQEQEQPILALFYTAHTSIASKNIAEFLSKRLLPYKLPSFYLELSSLPLTINGKIDRDALVKAYHTAHVKQTLPQPLVHQLILDTIREVLQLDQIDPHDNYFRLGGDSIGAIQISAKLANYHIQLSVKDILSSSSLKDILVTSTVPPLSPSHVAQKSLEQRSIYTWFFNSHFPYPNYYHQSILLTLRFPVSLTILENALNILIRRHDALRLNYNFQTGTLFYNQSLLTKPISLNTYALKTEEEIDNLADTLKSATDIERGHLLSVAHITRGQEALFLICIHHLGVDGISWHVLLEDLDHLLTSSPPLGSSTSSHQNWAGTNALSDGLIVPNIEYTFFLPEKLMQTITTMHSDLGLILTKAYLLTIASLTSEKEVWVMLEHHGRDLSHHDRAVGWFTVMAPFLFDLNEKVLSPQIEHAFQQMHQLSFDNPLLEAVPYTPYRFNYLGRVKIDYPSFCLSRIGVGTDSHPLNPRPIVDLNLLIYNRQFLCRLSLSSHFSKDHFCHLFQENLLSLSNILVFNHSGLDKQDYQEFLI